MEIQQYSTIHISIPKIKISHFEKNAFIYQIDVVTRWSKWHLQKKFDQFKDLHEVLVKQFNDLPEFPTNYLAFFMGQSEQAAQQNQQILQDYLRITSLRKDIINCEVYAQFLQIQKNAPLMLAHRPKFLAQFQIQQRINDEGKIIQDFYYNQEYVVFATGNNSPLQKFNSLIANTKFPWEEDEDIQFILPLGTVECWIKKKDAFKFKRIWTRNYPVQVKKLIFNPENEVMIVGLNDGGIQIFRLMKKGRNTYYEVRKLITVHEDTISGLHLDVLNSILYSSSIDGWINIIDVKKAVVIDTIQFHSQIYGIYGDSDNNRLFVSLGDGNIEIYEYDYKAKLRYRHTICTPQTGPMPVMNFDPVKNYFFVGCTQSGKILIFQIGKLGHQKITKQIGTLQSKKGIRDLIWNRQKMQLINCTQTGQIFFWDTVKGKQTFMLKVFDDLNLSKTMYIKKDNILITASQGRLIKFWQVPKSWRDTTAENEQQKQIQIRRKVQNLYRTREAIKRKQLDSSDDDLRGWHLDSQESDDSQQQGGIIDFIQQKLQELV